MAAPSWCVVAALPRSDVGAEALKGDTISTIHHGSAATQDIKRGHHSTVNNPYLKGTVAIKERSSSIPTESRERRAGVAMLT